MTCWRRPASPATNIGVELTVRSTCFRAATDLTVGLYSSSEGAVTAGVYPVLTIGATGDGTPLESTTCTLGPGGILPRLVLEPELDGLVAVAVLGPDLEDRAGADLQDGDRLGVAVVVVHLRHPDLVSEQSERHGNTFAGSRRV